MILSNMFRGHDCGMLEASERAMHGKEVSTAGLLEGVARACLRSIGLASINRTKAAGKAAFRSLTEMGPLVQAFFFIITCVTFLQVLTTQAGRRVQPLSSGDIMPHQVLYDIVML